MREVAVTESFHIEITGDSRASRLLGESILKQNGVHARPVAESSKLCMKIEVRKSGLSGDSINQLDNGRIGVEAGSNRTRVFGCLRKLGARLRFVIEFSDGEIRRIQIEPTLSLGYDLFCLRILLPAVNFNLHRHGVARIKASLQELGGKMTLVPGFSGSGKTTSALKCHSQGGAVLSETFLYVSRTGLLSPCRNTIQCFARNKNEALPLLRGQQRIWFIFLWALSKLSFNMINIPVHIAPVPSHGDIHGGPIEVARPKHLNYFGSFSNLQSAVDMNEYAEFQKLLNFLPSTSSNETTLRRFVNEHENIIMAFARLRIKDC